MTKGDPIAPPIVPASTYNLPGDPAGVRQYGRFHNPTWEVVESLLSQIEEAPSLAFPSGMAAISAVFYGLLEHGDRILLPSDGYYTTRMLAERFLSRSNIQFELRPTARFLDGGFDGFRMVFAETPSNPGLDICDIGIVVEDAHEAGALVVVDNTTMTPLGQRPLDLGADIVVAADTKAPNGHSDTLFGHVASRNAEIMGAIADWRKLAGAIPGPFEAWMVHRGLETIEIRFNRMCDSAEKIAPLLAKNPAIRKVHFPGLPEHPQHELAKRQMRRFGFLIGVELEDAAMAELFIEECPLIDPATSFGSIHTSAERRARWGDAVPEGFIRLSIGCEPTEPLWEAMEQALFRIR